MDVLQLVVIGIQGRREVLTVSKNCSIDQLFVEVCRKNPGVSAEEIRLVYGGTEMERGKGATIQTYDIPHMGQLFMVIRMKGGLINLLIRLPLLIISLVTADSVNWTSEPDMITLDDDPSKRRFKMTCGHVIGPDSLLSYCSSVLDRDQLRFPCPACSRDWNYAFIRKALISTGTDVAPLDSRVTETSFRCINGFIRCPGPCQVWTYRDPNETTFCVECRACTALRGNIVYRFCWKCLREWRGATVGGGGSSYCGNGDCAMGKDPRIRYLETRPVKIIGPVGGCPSFRGCARCGILIEHKEACKHMACKCGYQFCFVCLKPYNEQTRQFQCGAHNAACPVAPVQTVLPG